jgi:hypothetical protein
VLYFFCFHSIQYITASKKFSHKSCCELICLCDVTFLRKPPNFRLRICVKGKFSFLQAPDQVDGSRPLLACKLTASKSV